MFEKVKEAIHHRLSTLEQKALGIHEENAPHAPKRKFLLVESDKEFRHFVRDYMMNTHFDLVNVATGVEALERLQTETFEFVMVAAELSDMKGETLAEALYDNEDTKRIPVVMIMERPFPTQPAVRNIVACMERTFNHEALLKYIAYCFTRVTEAWEKGTYA